ncbi:MAG: hypothetical protein KGR26_16955, partial [Cyanobacteria bacterium REEB65]|nr:hypothetical protein [Cyanobacteria bacterium REEB65]
MAPARGASEKGMLQRTGRELENQTGLDATSGLQAAQSQLGPGVHPRQDNLGIEDSDPRWSERESGSRTRGSSVVPEPALDLGADEVDFQGDPPNPFDVLIAQNERRRQRRRPKERPPISLATGISTLDKALGDLDSRLYLVC